jgi:hypothetical protein
VNRSVLVDAIAGAIARMEGFYKAGSLAQRNNNPGNIRRWSPKVPVVDGFSKFPTAGEGWAALRRQVDRNVGRGLTLYQFFAGVRDADGKVIPGKYPGYAPSADKNDPKNYAEKVAGMVQIPADVPLITLIDKET